MAEAVTIARPYAVAVFRLAREKNALAKWSEMLGFASAVAADAQMLTLIEDPKLASADIERMFLSVCDGKLDETGQNLIKLLVEYGRLAMLPEIASTYEELKAQDEGTLDAEITSAVKLDDVQVKTLVGQLQIKFGKKVEASMKVDPEIIGGIKIVVGDTVIDASVRGRLQELAYTLKG
ncbi:ATP synthase subunit delta [mine drainage metagenome]|uniref:ATP synthase subunit delta n=1 Tax=mine drainage metagenome TaxID=410659 RepID=A0A1J5RM11_9ZZZZ